MFVEVQCLITYYMYTGSLATKLCYPETVIFTEILKIDAQEYEWNHIIHVQAHSTNVLVCDLSACVG